VEGLTASQKLLIFALCLLPCRFSMAEAPQELLKRGNALYAEGKFSEAASAYKEAQAGGLRHWALSYNLGNAYFKTGQLGRAVAEYHRAFRLNSGSSDVIFNLRLASARAGDPAVPQSALAALIWRLFFGLSINTLTVFVSLLFFTLIVPAIWKLAKPGTLALPSVVVQSVPLLSSLLAFLFLWLGARIYFLEKPIGVVVASPNAEVRSGPNTSYPASFTVPEGRRVLILKEQDPIEGWLEIGVPSEGLKGWVPDTAVEVL